MRPYTTGLKLQIYHIPPFSSGSAPLWKHFDKVFTKEVNANYQCCRNGLSTQENGINV